MKRNKPKTKQELVDFFNKNHRAPTQGEDSCLQKFMTRLIKGGDEEIIALYEKYRDNTREYISKRQQERQRESYGWSERISRIKKKYEETGIWPMSYEADYSWIYANRSKSEEISELWEEIKSKKMPKTPNPTSRNETKTVSELTLSEIPSFLKLIGNKTVAELIAEPEKPKEPEKVDISKIETTLSEDTIRTIINPEKEVVVTNPKWEKAKDVLEYLFADDSLKRHFAYEMLLESPVFAQEVAKLVRDNPKKTFCHKDKIVERMINSIPADRYYLLNPANIQDLVANCF